LPESEHYKHLNLGLTILRHRKPPNEIVKRFKCLDRLPYAYDIINNIFPQGKKSKSAPTSPSCEVQVIERLQKLEEDLESWEVDFMKASRTIKEKMYREYTNFLNRYVFIIYEITL